jgi:hypothetical protein
MLRVWVAIITVSFVSIASSSNASSFLLGKRFLDYGNGAINLDKVLYVNPKVNYTVGLASDEGDWFANYSSKNPQEIQELVSWLGPEYRENQDFYVYKYSAYIKLDNFTLTIIPEKTYISLPDYTLYMQVKETNPEVLTHLQTFMVEVCLNVALDLKDLKGDPIVCADYEYGEEFFQTVKDKYPEMTDANLLEIKLGLENYRDTYNKIVK